MSQALRTSQRGSRTTFERLEFAQVRDAALKVIYDRDGGMCVYCGVAVPMAVTEVDHVRPLSRGGTNTADNFVVTCRRCNRAKRDRTPEEWKDDQTQRAIDKGRSVTEEMLECGLYWTCGVLPTPEPVQLEIHDAGLNREHVREVNAASAAAHRPLWSDDFDVPQPAPGSFDA